MAFRTSWEPGDAASEVAKIARSGQLPNNVHQRVSPIEPERRGGGYRIECESIHGSQHDTKVTIFVRPDPVKGSIVDVVPWSNTSGSEANEVAASLKNAYFSD
jgi:hypothetical protein